MLRLMLLIVLLGTESLVAASWGLDDNWWFMLIAYAVTVGIWARFNYLARLRRIKQKDRSSLR